MLLAASSCEEANSVGCMYSSQPLDATTAFAVPYPGLTLAEQSVFSGLEARRVNLFEPITSLLGLATF